MANIRQIGKNIGDVFRGAYHGPLATALGIGEAMDGAIMEFLTLGEDKPNLKYCENRISRIPKNKYGVSSAISTSLCTIALAGFLGYKAIESSVDVLFGEGYVKTEQTSNLTNNLETNAETIN